MKTYNEDRSKVSNLKIAYIGGGSSGWAYVLMNDLSKEPNLSGTVDLYDINFDYAKLNEKMGNDLSKRDDVVGKWTYKAVKTLKEALTGADFVFCSILPGTFDEMEVDVHYPEKYGIWQPVGDSTGPGGIIRALRTIPMYKEFALAIKETCPNAWVVNFTNPMSVCVRTLYKVFPEIKAFGCCHEVFGTQKIMASIVEEKYGFKPNRDEILTNVVGVNHFTWLTSARYKDIDVFSLYADYVNSHPDGMGSHTDENWVNLPHESKQKVKFDLFRRYGYIAAAGDRHLCEFCPGNWFLKDPETVKSYDFCLTTLDWRRKNYQELIDRNKSVASGEKPFKIGNSGEESVKQIKALLGLGDFVTNVNIPNKGQVPNNPKDAVVETNAFFSADSVRPVFAGEVPEGVNALVMRIIEEQEMVVEAGLTGNYELAFTAFMNNPNVCLPVDTARKLFNEMLEKTKKYLPYYEDYIKTQKA
jgi:alpha-galactosidase